MSGFFCTFSKNLIMKLFFVVLTALMVTTAFGQEYDIINSSLSENVKVVYRGFENNITYKAPKTIDGEYGLMVTNASILRNGDHYILKPGRGKQVMVTLTLRKGEATFVAYKDSFNVEVLPEPAIYINQEISCNPVSEEIKYLQVKYKPQIPLASKFTVEGWQMLIDGELYFGENNRIPSMVNDAISKLPSGTAFTLKVKVRGEDGILRETGVELKKK